jgi:DNA processing protein
MRWEDEAAAWVALRSVDGLGDVAAYRLLQRLGDPTSVLDASEAILTGAGAAPRLIQALARVSRADAEAEVGRIRDAGARVIGRTSPEYPRLLREVPDAPLFVVVRGQIEVDAPAIAVVGARHATPYGRQIAARLAEDLAHAGITVVSGLARGIDAAAHEGALHASGHTVAVLGCGIDVVYPPEHRELTDRIVATGGLISERPVGTPPLPAHFPARNRIIAAMTQGTVVVEAAERSGSLITARLALEYHREVFAVPGRVDSPLSAGTHRLIQEGAKLTARLEDIVGEIAPALCARTSGAATTGVGSGFNDHDPLLGLFAAGPLSIDEIIHESGWPAAQVLSWVFDQELRGKLDQLPGKLFQLHQAGIG